jgi:hypothetical protein
MDPQRLKAAYQKLQALDERLTYRIRSTSERGLTRPGTEQLEERLRDLAAYSLELKEVLHELFLGLANRPAPPEGGS